MKTLVSKPLILCLFVVSIGVVLIVRVQWWRSSNAPPRPTSLGRAEAPLTHSNRKIVADHGAQIPNSGRSDELGSEAGDQSSLEKDLKLMRDPFRGSPRDVRECLQRHFPLDALIGGVVSESVMEDLRHAYQLFGTPFEPNGTTAKLPVDSLFGAYVMQMLRSDCPRNERDIFCKMVETLMQSYALYPDEHMFAVFLGQIFADFWTGWAGAEGKSASDVSQIWRSSELYRYLVNNEPPVSQVMTQRIQLMGKK